MRDPPTPSATTRRECGSCSLCCKVMGVPEVKQRHEWCPHAIPGIRLRQSFGATGGCAIYQARPRPCREFNCGWLRDSSLEDYWYPLKSKIVIDVHPPTLRFGETGPDLSIIAFIVDPNYPTRWREEPYFSDIKQLARAGIEGRQGRKWKTVVMIKDDIIPII